VNVLRVEAAVANTEAQLAGIDGQIQKLRAQLAALMGVDSFATPIVPVQQGPLDLPPDPISPPPSIQAATSNLQSTQDKLEAAKRAMYPQLALIGGWNRNAIQWDQEAESTWQLNIVVKLNLWAGGAQTSAIDAAQAASLESHYHLKAAEDNLRAASQGALAQWQAQKAVLAAAESGLRAAAESARIEQDRFKNGLGSATDLIDAEAALASARASVTSALAAWWQADDALRYAYGTAPAAFADSDSTPSSLTL
jgi:outer membrane protein TolC